MKRLLNFLICIDQLLYCIVTLGAGYPDETMSSAAYRMEQKGKLTGIFFRPIIDKLFGAGHCMRSYLSEVKRSQAPQG